MLNGRHDKHARDTVVAESSRTAGEGEALLGDNAENGRMAKNGEVDSHHRLDPRQGSLGSSTSNRTAALGPGSLSYAHGAVSAVN